MEKTLKDTLLLADSVSMQQSEKNQELEQTFNQLKAAKLVVEEEVAKEKKVAEEVRHALEEAKKTAEEAKKALLTSEESKKNLEA